MTTPHHLVFPLLFQVTEIDLSFSRISSIVPLERLKLFDHVRSLNLAWTGASELPAWTSELKGLSWVTLGLGRTVRVGKQPSGGLVRRSTDVWDFVMTNEQIIDMVDDCEGLR